MKNKPIPVNVFATVALVVLTATGNAQTTDLRTAYQQAAASSPLVAQTRARWEAEQFGKDIARSALAPQLTAAGSISQNNLDLTGFSSSAIDESYNPSSYSVTLTQPLINGSAWSTLQASRSIAESFKAGLLAVQQDLILQTADAYFAVLRAEALERTVVSRLTLLQKISDRAESERREGTGDIISVEEARARLDGAQSERLSARNGVQLARRALERLTHQSADALADLETLEPQGPIPARMEDWVQSAENSQPVLEQARQKLQASRYTISAASRGSWPVLSLNAQYLHSDGSFIPEMERRESLIGVSVVWPLFQGGAVRASRARAKALAQASQYGLEVLQDHVRMETQRSFLNLENSAAQLTATRRALESATTALKATQKGYEIGSRSVVEILDSEQRHANAESDYTLALYSQVLARMQLKASAGVLSEQDVNAINALLNVSAESRSQK
ncbi:TolC family outer membrane protein [Pontiella sulfatireligans]|uniref:Outer membrane protein TolC n=1 Tax=Pontiella sulfatireligans TaxID=2750658 RepID=A0A6C2UEC7_9BACT|nr:TolC family outer membrane protein [Pontiella sulfatireligans]VGO18572.1 Outer membrane protein TolC [Pontiella sulfatireligans]